MEINDTTAAEKQKVVEAAKAFVKLFVENFVQKKEEKFQIATGEVEKPGKYANMAGKLLSSVAIEGIRVGKILKPLVEFSGSYSNKEKATKIINLLTALKEEKLKKILIISALFIFKNFESQVMKFGDDKSEFNLNQISADAVDRVFEFLGGNKMEIDVDLITKGMIKGKSKTDKIGRHKNQVDGVATKDLFEKVGLLTLKSDGTPDKYYKRKNKQSIQVIAPETGALSIGYPSGVNDQYGYRLLFEWELEELQLPNDDYEEVERPKEEYAYIFKSDLLQKLQDDIIKELTNDKYELILQEIGKITDMTRDFQEKMLQFLEKNGCFEMKQMFEEIITKSSQLDQRLQGMETNIKEVKDEVLKMNTRLPTAGPSAKITEKPLSHFEKRQLNHFVGREKLKEDIAKLLEKNTVLVHGLPGVGKSELVAQFARSTYKKQDAVVWINANTKANLEASFNKLYNQLKKRKTEDEELTDVIDGVYNHNRVRDRKILFIFDGPEMLDEQFERFLPPKLPKEETEHRVLITSINDDQKWSSTRIRIEPLMLMGFTDEEAETFILKSLRLAYNEENRKDSLNLAKKLFNFPLALLQAVSYIKRFRAFGFTIKDYLNKYESQEEELLSFEHFKIVRDGYDKATFTALSISIDKLIEEKPDAVAILDVISYLAPDDISLDMIIHLTGFPDSDELRTIILLLKQYSVIEQKQKDVFKIHGLIQRIIKIHRKKMESQVLREALTKFIEMVTPKNFQTLLPHVISLWQHSKSHLDLVRDLITLKNDFIGYFHLICRGCSYEDFHAIFTIIDVKDILNAKGNEKSRRRPIHYAAVNGDPEIIKLLLENGADIKHKARQNWNVLHLASKHNNLEALKILLKEGENRNLPNWIDSKTEYGFTALHLSARNGHTDIVRHLLENGAYISDIDENGFQAVHHAAKNNHLETVKLLLENNGNVDAKTEKIETVKGTKKRNDSWGAGKTPLQFASMYGYTDMVVMLLEHGASVNLINDDGFTPLHYAAFYNHVDIVNILLEQKDINLEAVTTLGKTAFQLANERNNAKIMIKIVSRIESPDSIKIEFRKQLAPDSNQNVGLVKGILHVRAERFNMQIKHVR